MNRTQKWLLPILGLLVVVYMGSSAAPPLLAGQGVPMKCAANQDRVWVYESLGSFDVTAKLKCGETVEIIGRVKGFVKIHAASGVEGYVPESTFPNLPPLEDESNKPPAVAANAAQAAKAHAHSAPAAPASTTVPATLEASSPPAARPVASSVAAQQAPAVTPPHAAPAPPTPAMTLAHASAAPVRTAAAPAQPPADAPVDIVLSTSEEMRPATNSNSAAATSTASETARSAQPVASSNSATAPMKAAAATSGSSNMQPAASNTNTHRASSSASTVNSAAKTSGANPSTAKSSKSSASQPSAAGSTHPNSAPAPAAPPATPSNSKATESTANLQSSHPVASMHPVAATVESEDFPDSQPENASGDPACQIFFSAYGLTPDQIKWVTQNRKKRFPNVCPAPDTARVDFVMIFTHDVDFYGNTMPAPVHTDKNGFSDFSPMTMLDTTATPLSEVEKARREYVYVFKMKRGAFDPAKFSPRRRYQFTKAESNSLASSHASSRTVEDAFHFMEEQGSGE